MFGMHPKRLIASVDHDRVVAAIRAAEAKTSAEIRVSVSPQLFGSLRKAAEQAFVRLGMARTVERGGVLIFVAPRRRKFMVLGDAGIRTKAGLAFWQGAAAAIEARFRQGDFTGGLEEGIRILGEELARHFPRKATDRNELPDQVDEG